MLSGLILGAVLVPSLLFGIVAWQDRQSVLTQATQDIRHTTRVMEENAHNVFDTHKLVARLVDEHIRGMSWDEISRSESLHQYLIGVVHDFPKMRALWLVDPAGVLRGSSAVFPAPPVSLADRDYFIALREKDVGMFVGQTVHGRVLAEDIFNVAQRRSEASGGFDGVVVVSALPSYFMNFWTDVSRAESATEVLIRRDGTILARVPAARVGTPRLDADNPLMQAISLGDSGIYRATSPIDGKERITAFQRVDGFPLYVAHGPTISGILQLWRQHLLLYGGFFSIATAGLVALAVVADRRAAREIAAVDHWRETAQQLAEAAEQRTAVEAQLRQAQKMEAFGQFAGGMAHDFNNVLQVIGGSLEILKRRVAPSEAPIVNLAADSVGRGRKTIDSMLAFARQQALRSEVFDLSITVHTMQPLLRPALGSSVRLEIVCPSTPCWVRADRNQTELAILNLALNARDAMPDGGALTVTVGAVHLAGEPAGLVGEFGTVAVKDTGTGMSPEVQARVFEPFFTTKGPTKGTGLGLSMVYGFAEQSRGTVIIDSIVGLGTTFTLYLPAGESEVSTSGLTGMVLRSDPEPVDRG